MISRLSINKTPLFIAVEMGYIEMIKYLLSIPEIDVNVRNILHLFYFHDILNQTILIIFTNRHLNRILC